MAKITRAIILAAGTGSRLRPLTNDVPKALSEVNGRTILTNTLDNLHRCGIKKVIIVIGYCGKEIELHVGSKYKGLEVEYIKNEDYPNTNSMFSLWLARNHLKEGCLVIEGDIITEEEIIKRALNSDERSYWISDRFRKGMDGSMQITGKDGRIKEIRIVRETLKDYKGNFFKSVGMLKLSKEYGNALASWLDKEVENKNVAVYYDLVIAKYVSEMPLYVMNIEGLKWQEIDSISDIEAAEALFGHHHTRPISSGMKYVIIIGDGMADMPIKELGWKTPLEHAKIPNINFLAKNGKTGLIQTIYQSLPVGSIVANLGILGYNPARFYPNGRASFEAHAQGISVGKNDIALRCNLISLKDNTISDFTSGMIKTDDARNIISSIKTGCKNVELYSGQSYRHLLIIRDANFEAGDLITSEPHSNIGKDISSMMVRGRTKDAEEGAKMINVILLDSIRQIKELNGKFRTKADMLWVWSPSSSPILPSFKERYGITGSVVAGLDFMRGIGLAAGMETKEIPGATGYADTNIEEKIKYAKKFIRKNDFVFIHYNAPDEESHQHNVQGKVSTIEQLDKRIVGPMLKFLEEEFKGNFRIAVMPDHYTQLVDGKHREYPVPYLVYGKGISKGDSDQYNENSIRQKNKNVLISYEFMDFLISG